MNECQKAFVEWIQKNCGFTPMWVKGMDFPVHPFRFDPDEFEPDVSERWMLFEAGWVAGQAQAERRCGDGE